jgi:hypothetical protein
LRNSAGVGRRLISGVVNDITVVDDYGITRWIRATPVPRGLLIWLLVLFQPHRSGERSTVDEFVRASTKLTFWRGGCLRCGEGLCPASSEVWLTAFAAGHKTSSIFVDDAIGYLPAKHAPAIS